MVDHPAEGESTVIVRRPKMTPAASPPTRPQGKQALGLPALRRRFAEAALAAAGGPGRGDARLLDIFAAPIRQAVRDRRGRASAPARASGGPPPDLNGGPTDEASGLDEQSRLIVRSLLAWFGDSLMTDPGLRRRRLVERIDRDIAAIDRLMSEQVDAILHHSRFQRLEASWRGVWYLARQVEDPARIKVKLLDASWAEVCRDQDRAIEFDQSQLFDKVYSTEFGMPGGEPYGVLIGDYEVRHRRSSAHPTDDVAALKGIAAVAAAAFAPFIVGAAPSLLGLDSFQDLTLTIDLNTIFKQKDYTAWRSLREIDDARFVGVTAPRILMRLPHEDAPGNRFDFRYREKVEGPDLEKYLWGPASYAFGSILIRAFADYGWFADIRGAPRDALTGGLVTDLPVHCFGTDADGIAIKYSTDVSISEKQEIELSNLGFIPLSKCKETEYSVFYSNQSIQIPKRYDKKIAVANARLSSMLQYMMCVARFSHYVKVIGRDRVGAFTTPEECQDFLYRWLMRYCTSNDNAPLSQKARFPLREANVQVREQAGRPGDYLATVHLRPHYQLDQVVAGFRLVTEVASKSGQ